MGPIGLGVHIDGDRNHDSSLLLSFDNTADVKADAIIDNDIAIDISQDAVCIDENGRERKFGETWYFENDPCTVSACTESNEIKNQVQECDPYPIAPHGYKVVSEKSDDCCYIHRVIKSDCEPEHCEHSAPVCEYFEDLNHVPQDSCCSLYECSCNPTKCPAFGDAPCPPESKRLLVDDHSCCPVKKCVQNGGALAHAHSFTGTSLLLGDSMFKFEFGSGAHDDLDVLVDVKSDNKVSADVGVGSDVSVDVDVASTNDGPGHGYLSLAAGKYMLLASSAAKALASFGSDGNCPGIASVPDIQCPEGKYYDGQFCVFAQDCPCIRDGVRRSTGSVWRESSGCENCICIGGEVKCTKEMCEVTECPTGQKLSYPTAACCPVCEPVSDCVDSNNNSHEYGDTWINEYDCEECTCTSSGVQCDKMECADEDVPTCETDEMLVRKAETCCSSYECVCDKSACSSEIPTCQHEYEEVVATNPEECCPSYECVCMKEKCPRPQTCGEGEKLVSTECSECCTVYTCQKLGCTDDSGLFHNIGDTWEHATDSCLTCECRSDQNQVCSAKQCAARSASVCKDGKEPTAVFDLTGCCATYACDFTCTGYSASSSIYTFDGTGYSRSCPCTHVLSRDIFGLDFEISVNRRYCSGNSGSVCTDSFSLNNKFTSSSITLGSNLALYGNTNGFDIDRLASKVIVTFKKLGVVFEYDNSADSWEITLPAKFSAKTEGLCGMADTDASNDLWLGGYSIPITKSGAVTTFFNHWLVNPSAICFTDALGGADSSPAASRSFCAKIFRQTFSSCKVEKSEYLDTCARVTAGCDIPADGKAITLSWPGCSALASYATECSKSGTCQQWRNSKLCAYSTCDVAGATYSACGPSVMRTCDNFKTYSSMQVTYTSEGCFCSGDQVVVNGKCVDASECPICTDETNTGRTIGEQWRSAYDPCLIGTCQPEGQIMQSQVCCPEAPLCEEGEELITVTGEEECCPVYKCVPDDHDTRCISVTCPAVVKPVCSEVGETLAATRAGAGGCCMTYSCECNTATCVDASLTTCDEGEELVIVNADGCCPTATCLCKPDSCPASNMPSCSEGYALSPVESGRCCITYECVCDRSTCADRMVPSCSGGEVAEVTNPGDCCPSYECRCVPDKCAPAVQECGIGYVRVLASKPGDCCEVYECVCDPVQCPAVRTTYCPSTPGFRLIRTKKEVRSEGVLECCPSQAEEYCICDISSCSLVMPKCASYQRVRRTNPDGCCPEYECECDYGTCDRGDMSCPSNKHLSERVVNECCSTATCVCNECAEPEPCKDGYRAIDTKDDCGCITRQLEPEPMCFYDGESHEPGSVWMEDVCNECSCSDTPNALGEYESTCTITKCGTCSSGYTYVPVAGQCCGDCIPNVCHHNSKQYAVGQTWNPAGDTCKTCECMTDPYTNEVYTECTTPSCPEIDPSCPKIINDGCCQKCATEFEEATGCAPTVDFNEPIEFDGCRSAEPIEMTMCHGSCTSGSIFSSETGSFQKQCTCCTAIETVTKTANLTCPDGSIKKHTYEVATQCACQSSQCAAP